MGQYPFDTIIIINLKRRKDKLDRMLSRITSLGLDKLFKIEVFEAVDGRNINQTWLDNRGIEIQPNYFDPFRGRGMTTGEIGCALSHYEVWKKIETDDEIQSALILEDDAVFPDNFLDEIDYIKTNVKPNDWELFYLSRKIIRDEKEEVYYGNIVRPTFSYWCLAYIVNKSGAEKLIKTDYLKKLIPSDEYVPFMIGKGNSTLENIWNEFGKVDKLLSLATSHLIINPENFAFDNSETEKSKVYFKNNFYNDGIDSFVVVTVATEDNENLKRFKKSCEYYNVPYLILGMGDTWQSGRAENGVLLEPGGAQKINYLKKELSTWENLEDHIVMFTDSYDVVLMANPQEIVSKFRNMGAPIVFSTEKTCWPDTDVLEQYPETESEYKFLNSGGFIGYANEVLKLLNEEVPNTEDDQRYYTKKFLKTLGLEAKKITLDETPVNPYPRHSNGNRIGWMSEVFFDKDILSYLQNKFVRSSTVLDIGGGDGKWGYVLGEFFQNIDCVEIFEPYIERYNLNEIYREVFLGNFLDFEFDYYDVIIMGDVFEHVTQEQATEWLNKVKNKCGELIIVVPFEYRQDWDGVYENVYGHHHQPDLTPENMVERYPMLSLKMWTDLPAINGEGKGFGWFVKNTVDYNIKLDYNQEIFQTLNLAIDDVDTTVLHGRIVNKVTKTEPCVVHANGPKDVKAYLDRVSNFMFGQYDKTYGSVEKPNTLELVTDKTINLGLFLDREIRDVNQTFDQLRYLTYPKQNIDLKIYVNSVEHLFKTNKFVEKFGGLYRSCQVIEFTGKGSKQRDGHLQSQSGQDFCLVMDGNYIFRNRKSIEYLILENKGVVSPMIKEKSHDWINFSMMISDDGVFMDTPEQEKIATYETKSCWLVGYTAGIWLINKDVLSKIQNNFTRGVERWDSDDDYDINFSLNVKQDGIGLYLTNNNYFGGLVV
jgi:GR25 family glycosyltransferase involved in LPS biosynthesis